MIVKAFLTQLVNQSECNKQAGIQVACENEWFVFLGWIIIMPPIERRADGAIFDWKP